MGQRLGTSFQSVWTTVRGLSVHAKVSTAAKRVPLVLVHGLGLSHRYMMPTAECLAPDFHVFVPDLPGFGDSAHPREVLDIIPGLATGLLAWMDAIGLGRVPLLGNSHGCQIIGISPRAIRSGRDHACSRVRPAHRMSVPGSGRPYAGSRTTATIHPRSGRRPGRTTDVPATCGCSAPFGSVCSTGWKTSCRASRHRRSWFAASTTRSAGHPGRRRSRGFCRTGGLW
jgi:hypothetical protein